MNPALVIFIKNSIPGKVKTRLAQSIGNEAALKVYHLLLAHTQAVTQEFTHVKFVYYSDFIPATDEWNSDLFIKKCQTGPDLGQRMHNAFAEAFQAGHQPVIIIGSDCPELTNEHLQLTLMQLQTHDFVIGPATDGGYYLLAMNAFLPAVFENKTWSTHTVLSSTLTDIAQANQTVSLLPELSDIDTLEDWQRFKGK